jgi:hypothetical protein
MKKVELIDDSCSDMLVKELLKSSEGASPRSSTLPMTEVRSSATVKLTYTDDQTTDNTNSGSGTSCSSSTTTTTTKVSTASSNNETANVLTPGNLMSFKYDSENDILARKELPTPPLVANTTTTATAAASGGGGGGGGESVMHKLSIQDDEDEEVSSNIGDQTLAPGKRTSSSTTTTPAATPSASKSTAAKVKIADPKGPFELERLWRQCGVDEKMKIKCAKKWIRPDGKVASKIFGANKSITQSCPVDSDILCDLLLHRIKGMLLQPPPPTSSSTTTTTANTKKSQETFEDFLLSIEGLVKQPKFKSSIDFLSASHLDILDRVVKNSQNTPAVELLNSVLHP